MIYKLVLLLVMISYDMHNMNAEGDVTNVLVSQYVCLTDTSPQKDVEDMEDMEDRPFTSGLFHF